MLGMSESMSEDDLDRVEQRVAGAFGVLPPPWRPWLETREGTGGCSFVQAGGESDEDNELYFDVRLGQRRLTSPDVGLDAIVDFLGNAGDDVLRLLAEVRQLRGGRS